MIENYFFILYSSIHCAYPPLFFSLSILIIILVTSVFISLTVLPLILSQIIKLIQYYLISFLVQFFAVPGITHLFYLFDQFSTSLYIQMLWKLCIFSQCKYLLYQGLFWKIAIAGYDLFYFHCIWMLFWTCVNCHTEIIISESYTLLICFLQQQSQKAYLDVLRFEILHVVFGFVMIFFLNVEFQEISFPPIFSSIAHFR